MRLDLDEGNVTGIWQAMALRYQAPEWALFMEVANGTGMKMRRYADAIAMSLFPSRGLDLHMFEVKTDRGDWLREKKNPEKAEEIAKYCDFMWLVASDGVAKIEEIPQTWGWLVQQKTRLIQKKAPQRMTPCAIDRPFLAALLRRRDESVMNLPEVKAKLEAIRKSERELADHHAETAIRVERKEKEHLKRIVDMVSGAVGQNLNEWNAMDIGDAVKLVMNSAFLRQTIGRMLEPFAEYAHRMESGAQEAKKSLEDMQKILSVLPAPYTENGKIRIGYEQFGANGLSRWNVAAGKSDSTGGEAR